MYYDSDEEYGGGIIDIAKNFIDDSTRDIVNEKIKEVVGNIASDIDTRKLGKSILIGSVAGIVITIALYKILK